MIPTSTRQRLESLCTDLQQKTGAQLAIVTVRSLDDRPVEDYAVDLFKHLGIGAKKQDTGVLLLLAPTERKYRVEVGYGLEPILTDARSGDAGRSMVPLLRQNNFGAAAEVAAWQLAKYIADDKGVALSGTPPDRPVSRRPQSGNSHISPFLVFIILFIAFQIFSSIARRASGRGSGMDGCWWILPFLMGGGGRGGWGGGGYTGGGWGGSSGGGGFGGFGGGSSGGGGASGSW